MTLKINEISIKGYEKVVHATDKTTKLDCIISIHNTKLGPALGGVRSWSYKNFDEQKTDALKGSKTPFKLLGHVTQGKLVVDDTNFGFIDEYKTSPINS